MTEIWNKVKQPPTTALKQITGGRLKGMTDIKPQWRLQIMNEIFGDIGFGWSYKIIDKWSEKANAGEIMCFVHIEVTVIVDGKTSMPFPGIGGSGVVEKESSGMRANDEGYKMALTDALSVALKQLGVGSDIYMGRWDGKNWKPDQETTAPQKQSIDEIKTWLERIRKSDLDGLESIGKELAVKFPNKTTPQAIRDEYKIRTNELGQKA